jgi:hypothetical protein
MVEGLKNGSIPAICARCGQGSRPNDPWEAGHIVSVALGGGPEVRPEHRSCNRKAGAELNVSMKRAAIEKKAAARIATTESVFSLNSPRRPLSSLREKSAP